MAQTNLRIAAGVGVVAACLLVAGPSAAVAMADPGSRHGDHSDNNRGSGGSRSGSDYSDDNINNGANSVNDDRPTSRVGSGRESGTSDERPSSDFSPASPGQSRSPKVTFGDGRSPGIQDRDSGPRWGWRAPEPPPPPPPQVITVPLDSPPVSPPPPHPGMVQQLVVAPTAGIVDPLWGVAGLLLIPGAGAILGYRQARGAHAAADLRRHP